MSFEILVSTMNRSNYKLLDSMNIRSNAVVVNQCGKSDKRCFIYNDNDIIWIDSTDKGLSKSRNEAIRNSNANICIIADDDMKYIDRIEDVVVQTFAEHPEIDIIAFKVNREGRQKKKYATQIKKINYLSALKLSSVEIAFRMNSIRSKKVHFDERFGSGSEFKSGEESIWLYDCMKKGLKVLYVPITIGTLTTGESTWFKGYTEDFFSCKGAALTRMSRRFSLLLILQFAVRKRSLYIHKFHFLEVLRFMLNGRKELLRRSKIG